MKILLLSQSQTLGLYIFVICLFQNRKIICVCFSPSFGQRFYGYNSYLVYAEVAPTEKQNFTVYISIIAVKIHPKIGATSVSKFSQTFPRQQKFKEADGSGRRQPKLAQTVLIANSILSSLQH